MIREVIKVCQRIDTWFESLSPGGMPSVRYGIEKRSYPSGNSLLFAFDTLENARKHMGGDPEEYVFFHALAAVECKAYHISFAPDEDQTFWNRRAYRRREDMTLEIVAAPMGTLLCEWVELLEVIR
jgi:hypothetical protein